MAAFAAKGVQDNNFFNIKNLYENRGISFAMGGVSCDKPQYDLRPVNMESIGR